MLQVQYPISSKNSETCFGGGDKSTNSYQVHSGQNIPLSHHEGMGSEISLFVQDLPSVLLDPGIKTEN